MCPARGWVSKAAFMFNYNNQICVNALFKQEQELKRLNNIEEFGRSRREAHGSDVRLREERWMSAARGRFISIRVTHTHTHTVRDSFLSDEEFQSSTSEVNVSTLMKSPD